MRDFTSRTVPWDGAQEQLERTATALLRSAGAFRRGTGIRSPRSLRDSSRRAVPLALEPPDPIVGWSAAELWDEMDAIAARVGLSPQEKEVLGLARTEEYSLGEIAATLGITVHRVRVYLDRAQERCRAYAARAADAPCSTRGLFREEVRRRTAAVWPRRH
jgi:DNA-directed RNA polymerase specialized sigma24 family protein